MRRTLLHTIWWCWLACTTVCLAQVQGQAPAKRPGAESIDRAAWKVLAAGAADEKPARRVDAIAALGTMGPRADAVRLVQAALADKDADVRQTAASALGDMKARAAIPKLRDALDDDNADVSFTAARALWQMGDHNGRGILIDVVSGERATAKATMQSKMHSVRKRLRNPLGLGLTAAKQGAVALLGPLGIGVEAIEELARDRWAPGRALAVTLLARDSRAESQRQIEEALEDKNWAVRVAAAKALGGTARLAATAKLRPLLDDDKHAVRYMAAAAILRLSAGATRAEPPPGKKPSS